MQTFGIGSPKYNAHSSWIIDDQYADQVRVLERTNPDSLIELHFMFTIHKPLTHIGMNN